MTTAGFDGTISAMTRPIKRAAEARSADFDRYDEDLHLKIRLEELLHEARQEFLTSGESMLDWDGLQREIARRRGGVGDDD